MQFTRCLIMNNVETGDSLRVEIATCSQEEAIKGNV